MPSTLRKKGFDIGLALDGDGVPPKSDVTAWSTRRSGFRWPAIKFRFRPSAFSQQSQLSRAHVRRDFYVRRNFFDKSKILPG